MQYEGLRFRAECKLAGKLYGRPFGVDVAFGDPILGEPEIVEVNDLLAFAGIKPLSLRVYPVATHTAEKLHAYTMPRTRPNSRTKDLPDLALLAKAQAIDARVLRAALEQTFEQRKTHPLPLALPAPPRAPFAPDRYRTPPSARNRPLDPPRGSDQKPTGGDLRSCHPQSNELPLRSERRGDGSLLMSVGSNGIDDGGDGRGGWIIDGEWQTEPYLGNSQPDRVVGVPVPRRSPVERRGDAFAAPADVTD